MSITDGIELIITVCVLAYSGTGSGGTIICVLAVWWFVTREYAREDIPLSAVITAEFTSTSTGSRRQFMPTLFTPQGWKNLADSLAALVNGFPRDARGPRKTRAERRRERTRVRAGGRPGSVLEGHQ